jgi:phosphoribosylaminoimidazolecarboxamide formyltransferase/IMP cyclohydrolase
MTQELLNIRTALISVTDKNNLDTFVIELRKHIPELKIIASGGTAKALENISTPYIPLHQHTGFSECFGGRVKTLHPKIMGGILYKRDVDKEEASHLGIEGIDLVVCNLYDFATASKSHEMPLDKLIEHMDIGGSTLIRSACKNFKDVAVIVDPNDYSLVLEDLKHHEGKLSLNIRKKLAIKAINLSAWYESLLANELSTRLEGESHHNISLGQGKKLRYGENPDQQAWLFEIPNVQGVVQSKVLSGKELSYNNYEDATVAFEAVQSLQALHAKHAVAIVKHGNLCGFATGTSLTQSFHMAWEGDSKSAFGSVIGFISEVTAELIPLLKSKFVEVIIAPAFDETFIQWARQEKPNMRLLLQDQKISHAPLSYKSISGGVLAQTKNRSPIPENYDSLLEPCLQNSERKIGVVTKRQPAKQLSQLIGFGIAAVNFAKSNAICIVREYQPGCHQLLSVGAGQPNRIDSLKRLAIPKALENLTHENRESKNYDPLTDLSQCVLVSDGFFPFDDSVLEAAKYGINICVQPGGSTNDQNVIEAADKNNLSMIFTGKRYFYH